MPIDIAARAPITINRRDQLAAAAGARHRLRLHRSAAMSLHVAGPAEGDAVGEVEPQFRVFRIRLNMVRCQPTLVLLALAAALLTDEAVSLQDRVPPLEVAGFLEPLLWLAALPAVMLLAPRQRTPLDLGLQRLGRRLLTDGATKCLGPNLGASLRRLHFPGGVPSLLLRTIPGGLLQAETSGPGLHRVHGYPEPNRKFGIGRFGICCNEFFIHTKPSMPKGVW
jgi:hypothetical protein